MDANFILMKTEIKTAFFFSIYLKLYLNNILNSIYDFQVTTNIYNLILGKVYCDHHGTMHIRGNREYSCTLKFKEPSILDRNPHQVSDIIAKGLSYNEVFL